MNQAQQFLLEEEAVPVVFQKELESSGFVVSQEQASADIPVGYKANIPFWIAKELALLGIVTIDEPAWLSGLNAGATLTNERSYLFSADIAVARQSQITISHLMRLLLDRSTDITNDSLKTAPRIGAKEEKVYMTEEIAMIRNTKESTKKFLRWKKNNSKLM